MLSKLTQHIQQAITDLNDFSDIENATAELHQAMDILGHGEQESWGELLNLFVMTGVMTSEELEAEIEKMQ